MFPSGDGGVCLSVDAGRNSLPAAQLMGGSGGISPNPEPQPNLSVMSLGKVASLDSGGDLINVYLYDYEADVWGPGQTQVYKPQILRYSVWNGATLTYMDGTTRSYDATSLNARYQRRATWNGGASTEVQYITEPYYLNEWIWLLKTQDDNYIDINQAGRSWAALVT
jgi:hypothetical protein